MPRKCFSVSKEVRLYGADRVQVFHLCSLKRPYCAKCFAERRDIQRIESLDATASVYGLNR